MNAPIERTGSYEIEPIGLVRGPKNNEMQGPITTLPSELLLHIFSFLGINDLIRSTLINRLWHQLANDEKLYLDLVKNSIFGAADCEKFFGKINGPIPELSSNDIRLLLKPDPNLVGKKYNVSGKW